MLEEAGAVAPDVAAPRVRPPPMTLAAPLAVPEVLAAEPLTEPLALLLTVAGAEAVLAFVEGADEGAGTTAAAGGGGVVVELGAGGGAGVAGVP